VFCIGNQVNTFSSCFTSMSRVTLMYWWWTTLPLTCK